MERSSSSAVTVPDQATNFAGAALAQDDEEVLPEPHAAIRWTRAVLPIVDSTTDPRTIEVWGQVIHLSASAIRNWCFSAGIGPRPSLVFGRLLRAVILSEHGLYKPENLLDTVDRRTLIRLLRFAGLALSDFPRDVGPFLDRQTLVRDPEALLQVKLGLKQRRLL
jgi:hypothetical protein